jgi:methionine-gamma-lyase
VLGADVVVHSTTKYINGHGTVIGGAVVSSDPALMEEEIAAMIRFTGGVPSAFDCWLTNLGLKTLPLRMHQHCSSALQVAAFLDAHSAVAATHYPGLKDHPQHDVAKRQMAEFGAMISFDLGSYGAATRFMDRLRLCTLAVSLGNIDTLVEHPASMTHRMVSPEDRARSGITDGLVRISVGLESVEDLISDLDHAMAT